MHVARCNSFAFFTLWTFANFLLCCCYSYLLLTIFIFYNLFEVMFYLFFVYIILRILCRGLTDVVYKTPHINVESAAASILNATIHISMTLHNSSAFCLSGWFELGPFFNYMRSLQPLASHASDLEHLQLHAKCLCNSCKAIGSRWEDSLVDNRSASYQWGRRRSDAPKPR